MSSAEETPKKNTCAMYGRLATAFVGTVLLFSGVGLQLFSAGNLYSVPLSMYCQAYSGTPDLSTIASFRALISSAFATRQACLALNGTSRDACCATIGGYTGLCARPDVQNVAITSTGTIGSAHDKMSLLTSILGGFFGVSNSAGYDSANAEFWCKNCPNDYRWPPLPNTCSCGPHRCAVGWRWANPSPLPVHRKNCPFVPTDSGGVPISNSNVCNCPGGAVSQPGQAFWATVGDSSLAADYIQCSDKTQARPRRTRRAWPPESRGKPQRRLARRRRRRAAAAVAGRRDRRSPARLPPFLPPCRRRPVQRQWRGRRGAGGRRRRCPGLDHGALPRAK